ncbi:reverse transcriptase domain-containing protein [Tanacetum coccineum]|uniref:Reverse transcriptase domain-containing protein n=1 Tax=Tanacetum coccineum TaxID=301880 RepID=A0ABQ5GGT3_9ASTR
MRTRSQSRRRRQQQVTPTFVEPFDLEKPNNNQEPPNPPVVTMADNRTMAEMLQAPTEGYEDAIVVPAITADNFELKHKLNQLDTFYNALNSNDKDSLNSAAGGNFLDKMPRECLRASPKFVNHESRPLLPNPPLQQSRLAPPAPVVASKTKPTLHILQGPTKEKLHAKDDISSSKFMEIFQNLHFELTFANALLHMPKFAPMFRKLLNDKDKIIELTKTLMNVNVSLANLSASHQPMPLSIWKELSLSALTKTRMILELADRTISTPTGIAEDVFVKVGTFFFPTDFVVVDYVTDPRVRLILGRPFLRTARALIDVHGEQMTLRHDDQSVTFKVGDTKTFSYNIIESVNRVDVIDITCEEYVQEVLEISQSGNPTSTSDFMIDSRSPSFTPFGGNTVYLEELLSVINSDQNLPPSPVCEINVPEKIKSSCEDPPDLELKDLPSHLEYAFLEGDDKLPVIIAKNLKDEDKTALIKVLKSHKHAIAWKISDIKGIDPQFCTHKILMEENAKPVVQITRRVNQNSMRLLKQEVIKLLDAGLIYPISDSPWDGEFASITENQWMPRKISIEKDEKLSQNGTKPDRMGKAWNQTSHRQSQAPPPVVEQFNLEEPTENPDPLAPMDDNRTMAQLLEAPTAGYEDAIVVPQKSLRTSLCLSTLGDCLRIIEIKSKVRNSRNKPVVAKVSTSTSTPGISSDVAELKDMVKALLLNKKNQSPAPTPVKAVVQPPAYQAPAYQAPAPQIQGVSKEDFHSYVKANDAVMRNMQTQGQNMQNQLTNLTDMLSKFVTSNTASTSGTLPSNTVTNPKEDLKGITTRSGVAYKGPTIHTTSSPKVVERDTEVTKDTMHPTNNGSTEDVPPPVVPIVHHESISEPANAPVSASKPNQKASIPFPSRRNDERRREKANDQIEKFYEIFRDLSFEISFTDALMLMPKFASTLKTLIGNKEKLSEMARTPLNKRKTMGIRQEDEDQVQEF